LNTDNELKYNHPIAGDSRGLNQWRIEPTEQGCYKQHRTHSLGTAPMQNEHPPTEKYPHSYLWTRCSTHQQLWSNSWRCILQAFFFFQLDVSEIELVNLTRKNGCNDMATTW
jgi:hypothetical protein